MHRFDFITLSSCCPVNLPGHCSVEPEPSGAGDSPTPSMLACSVATAPPTNLLPPFELHRPRGPIHTRQPLRCHRKRICRSYRVISSMIPSTVVRSSAFKYMGRINITNHLTGSVNEILVYIFSHGEVLWLGFVVLYSDDMKPFSNEARIHFGYI